MQMVQNLEGMGFTVVPFGQGYKDMSPPTKELMKLTLEERIAHGGHKVLRWMMDTCLSVRILQGISKWIRKNPRRRLMGPLQPSWHLIVQSGMRAVTEVCMMTVAFSYSDAAVYDSLKS